MMKLASIVLSALALVATNAVRKSSVYIKIGLGDGEEDIQIHQLNNIGAESIENRHRGGPNILRSFKRRRISLLLFWFVEEWCVFYIAYPHPVRPT